MRRALSILLVLFFGLGPLTATLQGSDDSRLPACCRRNGAHHCVMAEEALARIVRNLWNTGIFGPCAMPSLSAWRPCGSRIGACAGSSPCPIDRALP